MTGMSDERREVRPCTQTHAAGTTHYHALRESALSTPDPAPVGMSDERLVREAREAVTFLSDRYYHVVENDGEDNGVRFNAINDALDALFTPDPAPEDR